MEIIEKLSVLLADTYALYLKTQNYHWHVSGPLFKPLHDLFEEQYNALALAVDEIAERILTLGGRAPATFKDFERLKTIKEGNSTLQSSSMVMELADDNATLVQDLNAAIRVAQEANDEGSVSLLSDRIVAHEKAQWMLKASSDNA